MPKLEALLARQSALESQVAALTEEKDFLITRLLNETEELRLGFRLDAAEKVIEAAREYLKYRKIWPADDAPESYLKGPIAEFDAIGRKDTK